MEKNEQKATVMHLGKHLIKELSEELQQRFVTWQGFAKGRIEDDEAPPSMPVEMNVVTMKVADGEVFTETALGDLEDEAGVPMKIEVGRPWFPEFKDGRLPRDGEDVEYTPKTQIPTLIKAIMSEQPSAVGFLYVAESWVWRGALSDYVPYDQDPDAGPREEALVVTFHSVTGDTVTGVMPIADVDGQRSLKPLEFGQPFNGSEVVN